MSSCVAALTLTARCGGTVEIVTPPPPPPIENATLRLLADPEDAAVATALGWGDGLPQVQVRLQATTPASSAETLVGSVDGTVLLSGLAPGDYAIDITRWLTPGERAKVPVGDETVGFARRDTIRLGSSAEVEIPVPASRRTGLVISEWAFAPIYSPSTGSYHYGGFLEVYNNGDTTVFLDGLLVGEAWTQGYAYPARSCAAVAGFTTDPSGLWVRKLVRFPGSGREHALPAGGVVVLATDAIDHRPLSPGGLDLSHADFEFIGSQDVDNPSVPNLVDVGLFSSFLGHGLDFDILASIPFLAKGVDPSALERKRPVFFPNGEEVLHIRNSDVLDAAAILSTYEFMFPLCPRLVSPAIDRETARLIIEVDAVTETILSVHRIMPAGQTFLQDTRNSKSDLVAAPRTPGRVP